METICPPCYRGQPQFCYDIQLEVPHGTYCTRPDVPQCKFCGAEIRVSHMTMEGPQDYVHVLGGSELCVVDGAHSGTRAELAEEQK